MESVNRLRHLSLPGSLALGVAVLLAAGFAVEASRVAARAAAAAALPVLAVTAYFTFSRGAWVALAALNALPPPFGSVGEDLPASFADATIPGRFDIRGGGRWIFDVAHNPDGMEVLVAALREERPARPLHALVGIRNDKEWRPMLERLLPEVDRLVLTVGPTVPAAQRWVVEDLSGWTDERVIGQPVVFEPDFANALELVQEGAATVLVTGSFHTVGDAMARLPAFAPSS